MFGTTGDQLPISGSGPNWYVPSQQQTYPDFGWSQVMTTVSSFTERTVKLTAKKHAVVSRATGQVVEAHDSKDEALAAAKRLAAKEQDEYWVFSPTVTVRPKPVDLEVIE